VLYKKMSKERRKGNPPTPNILSLCTICLPRSNHSSCSDVPSKSFPMILHTISATLFNTTTQHHPMLPHLQPLPYQKKLCHHPYTIILYPLCLSRRLLPSITPLPSCFPWNSVWLSLVHPSHHSIPPSGLRSLEDFILPSWLLQISFMRLFNCF